jgi:hypothetical protein
MQAVTSGENVTSFADCKAVVNVQLSINKLR